ncbi:putative asparagine synthase [Mycena crocata]|nr:putative asparagine synthase [Mycena crocata]
MCGLTAVFHPDGVTKPSADDLENQLHASLEIIKHRGPDSRGTYVSPDARVGLGHVRLSIIDLLTGQQPLSDEDGLMQCVVTGVIYDHERLRDEMERQGYSFKTKSDSELVVQLYKRNGFNLLFNLRGEFVSCAFRPQTALLHRLERSHFIRQRDPGFNGSWQAEWDIDSLVNRGESSDDRTLFKGVQRVFPTLPPGYSVLCRASGYMKIQAYWNPSYPSATAPASDSLNTMISTVRSLLIDSVRLRLRSDVPLACTSAAGSTVQRLQASRECKIDNHYVGVYCESAVVDALEESIWHSEQVNNTFRGASEILLSRAVRSNGYKLANADPASVELGFALPSDADRRELATEIAVKPAMPQGSMFRPEVLEAVGTPDAARCREEGIDPRVRQCSVSGRWHNLAVSLYVTTKTVLETILSQVGDRSYMANSVESRVAFLNHHLVEYVNTLPPSVKIMPIAGDQPETWCLVEKWILRQAVKPFITDELYRRKKVPFNPATARKRAPESGLLPLQLYLKARITQASVQRLGCIDWTFAEYLDSPKFSAHGMDQRASVLMNILRYIVLQERFFIPTLKL